MPPLANSRYVLLSPGFNSSKQKGFERTVSRDDTIQNIGLVLQWKGIPPFRCLRQNTHFYDGRYLFDQIQTHGSLASRIHRCRITNGFVASTRSMTLTLSGMHQQCSSANGSQLHERPCCTHEIIHCHRVKTQLQLIKYYYYYYYYY
jgi:hypothetical protein